MPQFKYQAMDSQGVRKTGSVEARNTESGVALLKEQGLYVVSISKMSPSLTDFLINLRGVPFGEIVAFTRQLSTMISAGLPISKALNVLMEQTENTKFKKVLYDIVREVEGGSSFSSALSKYPDYFPTTYQSLVRAGEASGKLDEILNRLADTMEAQRELRAKFKAAMIYPSIVFMAMIGVFIMLMVFVIPKLAQMYESLNVQLPSITRAMIGVSNFMANNLLLTFGGGVAFVFLIRYFLQTDGGKSMFTYLSFKMPVFGGVNKKREITEFTRTLGLLVASAVPIVESLHIVAQVAISPAFRRGATEAAKSIERGGTLSNYLKSDPTFPPILGNMVATGEETGRLDEILTRLADFFESETQHAVEGLSAAMEPMILIMLGGMVGFLIISIILPIYQITQAL